MVPRAASDGQLDFHNKSRSDNKRQILTIASAAGLMEHGGYIAARVSGLHVLHPFDCFPYSAITSLPEWM